MKLLKYSTIAIIFTLSINTFAQLSSSDFSFILSADTRHFAGPEYQSPEYFLGICTAISNIGPGSFMISSGDIDPPWNIYSDLTDALGKNYTWYPVVGNHEAETEEDMVWLRKYYFNHLEGKVNKGPANCEETTYSFDYNDAHFAIINQYYDGESDKELDGDVSEALFNWLKSDLESSDKKFKFVIGHEPIVSLPDYDNGRHRHKADNLDKYPENSFKFQKLLRENNVTAYVCGHTHNFSIAKLNGIWQIDPGHARGKGDAGAASTFIKMNLKNNKWELLVYRSDETFQKYSLWHTFEID
ncbi:MAG: metallophosphoesterase [Bacteroidota bacterium]